jgi:BirA family biotin operon repressor/biotin-[acetyl-CoA-carboxylase] ligase
MTDLHPAAILERCGTVGLCRSVVLFDEIDSTNRSAAHAVARGEEGIIFLAEQQVEGYGRNGRRWHSASGKDLITSFTLWPERDPHGLTSLAALACARALSGWIGGISIKWPNDLYIGERKVGGILAETKGGGVVLGIGLNVNGTPDDFPEELRAIATSIRIETGSVQRRYDILVGLIETLESLYKGWTEAGLAGYIEELSGLMLYMGEEVSLERGETSVEGVMSGITDDGRLRLEVSGEERCFAAGDLTMRRRR